MRLRQAIALRPDYAAAYNNLGTMLKTQGKLDEAVAQFQRALALRPDLFEAHNNLGDVFHEQGRLDQAVAQYQQGNCSAARPRPRRTTTWGRHWAGRASLDAAAAHCQRAIALRPDFAAAHNNLGNIFRKQGQLDVATPCFEQALALDPDDAAAHKNLGNVLRSQNKLGEAAARYERALALRPDYPEAQWAWPVAIDRRGLRAWLA